MGNCYAPAALPSSDGVMGNNTSTRIERAEKTGVLVLQKQVPPLTKIPDRVLALGSLRTLDLNTNAISRIGPSMGELGKGLTMLTLTHNKLAELDPAISQLVKLEMLDVRHNKLAKLPREIGGCTRLKKLHLDANVLTELPPEIGALGGLTLLTASENRLASLPDEVGQLGSLVELDLTNNALLLLPDAMGGCKRLRWLKVRGNAELGALPVPLLVDTALDRVEVDDRLLGGDGLLSGEGSDVYNERRKALVDKEVATKMQGGDLKFST